jgi:hypothetical protein
MAVSERPFKLEPGKHGWPAEWPACQRISREQAVSVVEAHKTELRHADYELLMCIAEHYPWAYPSRAAMAERLATSISGVTKRLRKLERKGLLESFPTRLSQNEWETQNFDNARSLRRITLPGLHVTLKHHNIRRCAHCGGPVPEGKRADARYCREGCRKMRHRARKSA